MEYPAILTGMISRLPVDLEISMDGATHLLTNPMGMIRLKAIDGNMLECLLALEGSAALIRGNYGGVEGPNVQLIQAYRIDLHALTSSDSNPSTVWELQQLSRPLSDTSVALHGPGDAWPWVHVNSAFEPFPWKTFPSQMTYPLFSPSEARIEEVRGQSVLNVTGEERFFDECQQPVATQTSWDESESANHPDTFFIHVGVERDPKNSIPLKKSRKASWAYSRVIPDKIPLKVYIVHPDRHELIMVESRIV
jgi:hypothetical protein